MTRIDLLATEPGAADGTLYRALRDDVEFPFALIAPGDGYEVVREDGAADTEGGVVLIDPFEVADDEDEDLLVGWDAARAGLAGRRGYLGARLYRSSGPATFRFIDVARWSSPLMVFRAGATGAVYQRVER